MLYASDTLGDRNHRNIGILFPYIFSDLCVGCIVKGA